MDDREKRINEMSRDMCFHDNCSVAGRCYELNCETTWVVEKLIDLNYRKIDKDDVVLPKDEYRYLKDMANHFDPFWFCSFGGCEGVCKECIDTCEMSIFVKERKATAEKCMQLLENMKVPEDSRHEWRDHHNDCIDKCKAKLAKEFEIEIKEKQ